MYELASEIRQALRRARRNPGASLAIVLTLGLAIGASTAIFSLFSAVALRPLPFEHAGRLVWIACVRPERTEGPFSLPEFIDYRDQTRSLDELVAYASWSVTLTGRGHADRLQGIRASANAFTALGVQPARGRLLAPSDDRPEAPRVAVLGYDLWRRRFGADDGIVGQTLRLDGHPYVVVGVLPRSFPLPQRDVEIVVPLAADQDPSRDVRSSASFLRFIGRLRAGVDPASATRELDGLAARLRQRFPVEYARKLRVRLSPLQDEIVGDSRQLLVLMFAAVLLLLGVACGNVVGLFLARAVERRREIAVRIALGAGRAAIARQLLVEGSLHALVGGACGLLLALWGLRWLLALAPARMPRLSEAGLDGGLLTFVALVTLSVAVVSGMAPVGQALRLGAGENLMATRSAASGAHQQRLRRGLICAEIAVAVVLMAGAVLVRASLVRLQQVDPGFETRNVLVARVALPRTAYTRRAQLVEFYDRFMERLSRLPGVEAAGTISVAPFSGNSASTQFTVEGRPPLSAGDAPEVQFRLVSPGYLDAVGTRLLLGRPILETDRELVPPVALVNQALAERFLGPEPLGKRILLADNSQGPRPVEVIGVVANVKQAALEAAPTNDVYLPWAQAHADHVAFLTTYQFWTVRAAVEPTMLGESFRRELEGVDPEAAASQLGGLQQYVDSSLAPRRFSVLLIGAFALAALALAMVGLYAIVAYTVGQQTHEIGVRIALGARPADIYRLVLGQALGLAAAGTAAGLGLCVLSRRALASQLFGIGASDPAVLLGVAFAVTAIGLAASYLPARRAVKVDPIVTLRGQ